MSHYMLLSATTKDEFGNTVLLAGRASHFVRDVKTYMFRINLFLSILGVFCRTDTVTGLDVYATPAASY